MAKNEKFFNEMPHSIEAEQAFLGCLLLDAKVQVETFAFVKEDDFYSEAHKYIFSAMEKILKMNRPVDLVSLTDELEKEGTLEQAGGINYITDLANSVPSSANYKTYQEMIVRDSVLRRLMRGATDIIEVCKKSSDEIGALDFAEKTVFDISNTRDTSEISRLSEVIPQVMDKFDKLATDKSAYRGIKTKYKGLDNLLNGLHGSDLMILAARPAVGKTSLAMNIVENLALQGYSCAVFSLEMGKEQLAQRMLCSVAGVSMEHAAKGMMDKKEWMKITKAKEVLSNAKIYIDDSAIITPQEALSKCRRLQTKNGLDFVMVDYIQLMTSAGAKRNSDTRQNEITDISRNLKILAKQLNVPVLALSQLSRAVEAEKRRPQLSDLRESGAIEQDADIVMFIHRPDQKATPKEIAEGQVQENVAEIIVAKHRNGPTGLVKLYFKGECTKFVNIDAETNEPEVDEKSNKDEIRSDSGYEKLTPPPEEEKPMSVDDEMFQ